MINLREFLEIDESKKDYEWAMKIVTYLRFHMQPVVSVERAQKEMATLLGDYPMEKIKGMYKDPTKAGVSFLSIAVLEKLRNVIVAKLTDIGVQSAVTSIDPTSIEEKRLDQAYIENKRDIEGLLTYINTTLGKPPFKLENEEQITGEKPYHGNIEDFDKMGLDPNDPEDVSFFMQNFHKLDHEIAIQEPVDYFMKNNDIAEKITMWSNDMMAKKCVAAQVNVNDTTGAIDYNYLAPETTFAMIGKRKDFKDATMLAYEDNITVADMIKKIGNDFDYDKDMNDLLRAVNHSNRASYTGIHTDGNLYLGQQGNLCSYSEFLQFKVKIGYIEWKSINASAYKVTDKNYHGNFSMIPAPVYGEPSKNSIYARETRYKERTYKAYYLVISPTWQKLYKYGQANYQQIEGAEDERSNFTILIYKEVGRSITEIAAPFIDLIQKSFSKFEYMVVRAKPPGRGYNYESLVQIATEMFPENNAAVGIDQVINMFYDNANEIYTFPQIDGKPMGGGVNVNYDIPHGISKSVVEFKNIIDWALDQIRINVGIAPLMDAYSPKERDGYQLQMKALNYSEDATRYIPQAITNIISSIAERTVLYCQDIINYKDRNTVPYKYLVRAINKTTVNKIGALEKVAMHRYGYFIESMDQTQSRAEFAMILGKSLENKTITTAQYMLVKDIKAIKRAYLTLAYFENRNLKLAQRAQMQQSQMQQQGEMQVEQERTKQTQIKGNFDLQVAKTTGEYALQSHIYSSDAGLYKKQMETESKHNILKTEAELDTKKLKEQSAINSQNDTPQPSSMPPASPNPQEQGGQQPAEAV